MIRNSEIVENLLEGLQADGMSENEALQFIIQNASQIRDEAIK